MNLLNDRYLHGTFLQLALCTIIPPYFEKPLKPAAIILPLHRRFKDSLTFAQEQGQLSSSQKQAMNTLLEKKEKVRRFIKNWRPISLINVDVKIASTAIARRLETILPELIHQNQNGFIKGRSVFDAVRTIDDLLELVHNKQIWYTCSNRL